MAILKTYTSDEYIALQIPYHPLVHPRLLSKGGKMVLYGGSGVGKSYAVSEMGWQMGQGVPVFDAYPVEQPLRGLYIQVEVADYELQGRVKSMRALWGECPNFIIHTIPRFSIVERAADVAETAEYLKLDFIIYDPWYMMIDGGENSLEEVRPVLSAINDVASATGVATIVLAHTKKETYQNGKAVPLGLDALSGHKGLVNWADTIASLTGDKVSATLAWQKVRNGKLLDPVHFVRDDNGLLIPRDSDAAKTAQAASRTKILRLLLAGPATLGEMRRATGLDAKAAEAVVRAMQKEAVVVPTGELKGTVPTYKIQE